MPGSLRKVVAVAALLALGAGIATAVAGEVPVPSGFRYLCEDYPQECRGGGARWVALTEELLGQIKGINSQVNRSIKPVPFEPIDIWTPNASRGDCEDYVLAKRQALIRLGIPASALSYVYALRNGGGHAVLAVHTDHGTLVLDYMNSTIRPLERTGYQIVSMSGPDPRVWFRPLSLRRAYHELICAWG